MSEGTMSIGRIGLATASGGDGFSLYEASDIAQTDKGVTVSGIQNGLTDVQITWLRDQFLGLGHGFEPTIPVQFTTWPELDGFYAVRSATADRTPAALAWSVGLERVADWRTPRVDAFSVYGLINNGVSITATTSYLSAPPDITQWSQSRDALRTTSDGVSEVNIAGETASSSGTVAYPSYTVPIASYYKGGARVFYDPNNDGTQRLVVGRKGMATRLDDILITNGLVRVSWSAATISASWYSGDSGVAGTWESASTFYLTAGTFGNVSVDTATVIQNTPECVTVRYQGHSAIGLGTGIYQTIDVSVRRGSRTVSCYVQSTSTAQWLFGQNSAPAMTAVGTPTIRYTSNDADGNRLFLTSTQGSADTTNKRVGNPSTRTDFNFGFGFELGGTGSTSLATITNQIQDYFNPVTTTERVATL